MTMREGKSGATPIELSALKGEESIAVLGESLLSELEHASEEQKKTFGQQFFRDVVLASLGPTPQSEVTETAAIRADIRRKTYDHLIPLLREARENPDLQRLVLVEGMEKYKELAEPYIETGHYSIYDLEFLDIVSRTVTAADRQVVTDELIQEVSAVLVSYNKQQ